MISQKEFWAVLREVSEEMTHYTEQERRMCDAWYNQDRRNAIDILTDLPTSIKEKND